MIGTSHVFDDMAGHVECDCWFFLLLVVMFLWALVAFFLNDITEGEVGVRTPSQTSWL